MKQTRNNVYVNLPLILTEVHQIFRDVMNIRELSDGHKIFRNEIFLHFLVAIADPTHPISNNRSSIGMIGC